MINGFAQISVHGVALSDREASVHFAVSEISTLGRIADSDSTGNCRLPAQFKEFIEVPACRLDWIVENEKQPLPNLVKKDVEGAEVAVLRGATTIKKSARPLFLIELHGTNKDVYEILRAAGYRVGVLGSQEEVCSAHWNSHIIAVPEDHRDAVALLSTLCIQDKRAKV